MQISYVLLIEIGPWNGEGAQGAKLRDQPLALFAADALTCGRRQVIRRGRGFEDLDREGRHRLRIATKRLRYSADVFGQIFPSRQRRAGKFLGAAKDLLEVLGELTYSATAETLRPDRRAPPSLRTALAGRLEKVLARARPALRRWGKRPDFWSK